MFRDILQSVHKVFGDEHAFADGWVPSLREKLSNLSEFVREIKVGFARYYNKRHHRRGYFWGDRFKSVIVENGETLINCLAYIDLNPLRAGLVERPETNGTFVQSVHRDSSHFAALVFLRKNLTGQGKPENDPASLYQVISGASHVKGDRLSG